MLAALTIREITQRPSSSITPLCTLARQEEVGYAFPVTTIAQATNCFFTLATIREYMAGIFRRYDGTTCTHRIVQSWVPRRCEYPGRRELLLHAVPKVAQQ